MKECQRDPKIAPPHVSHSFFFPYFHFYQTCNICLGFQGEGEENEEKFKQQQAEAPKNHKCLFRDNAISFLFLLSFLLFFLANSYSYIFAAMLLKASEHCTKSEWSEIKTKSFHLSVFSALLFAFLTAKKLKLRYSLFYLIFWESPWR